MGILHHTEQTDIHTDRYRKTIRNTQPERQIDKQTQTGIERQSDRPTQIDNNIQAIRHINRQTYRDKIIAQPQTFRHAEIKRLSDIKPDRQTNKDKTH